MRPHCRALLQVIETEINLEKKRADDKKRGDVDKHAADEDEQPEGESS